MLNIISNIVIFDIIAGYSILFSAHLFDDYLGHCHTRLHQYQSTAASMIPSVFFVYISYFGLDLAIYHCKAELNLCYINIML